ncbi:MAG: GT-D fold domain-containing protein [Endomicrobium sp.]|jgi:glycosyltransferase family protein|nr:GT-D fold domain-containing protein [Endomicrobium sp.]
MKKKENFLKIFINNLRYLFRYNIKQMEKNSVKKYELPFLFDNLKYELEYDNVKPVRPEIFDYNETIDILIKSDKSLIRYGDGEFMVMMGKSIPFQEYNEDLADKLKNILKTKSEKILIGIPYVTFYSFDLMTEYAREYMWQWSIENRKKIIELIDIETKYCDTLCSQVYANYNIDFKEYFKKVQMIWEGKDIVIICGDRVFKNIKNNIFDNAASIKYLYTLSKNAFYKYDEILKEALKEDKERLIIVISGPTANILVNDLAKNGYRALDFGHIAKDYDYYIANVIHTKESNRQFFSPD